MNDNAVVHHEPESKRAAGRLSWIVLGFALLFYLFTLRPGHRAGDFAMYLQHTVNMAEGAPYAATPYFQNPAAPSVGTKSYPPGLPLILLPVYMAFGLNLGVMKALLVVMFFAGLFIFWRLVKDHLTAVFGAVMLFDIAFTPYFWSVKENVQSDFPFLLPVFLALFLMSRCSATKRDWYRWILLGLAMYAAVVIRPIGLTLAIALGAYDVVDRRHVIPGLRFWVPTGILVLLIIIQGALLPLESGSYASAFFQEAGTPAAFVGNAIRNAKYYILACISRIILSNGHGNLWGDISLLISIVPFGIGFVKRVLDRIGIAEVFFVVYTGILIVWPFRQPTYLIPVIPLLSFYVFVGLETIAVWMERWLPKAKMVVAMIAFAMLAATFGQHYATLDFAAVPHDVMSPASMKFYERIKSETPPDAVILTRVPRTVAFFTGRRSTTPNLPADHRDSFSDPEVDELLRFIREVRITHVASGPKGKNYHREILPLWEITEEMPMVFTPSWSNSEWRLYTISPQLPQTPASETD